MIRVIFRRPAFDRMGEIIRAHPGRVQEFAAALRDLNDALAANPEQVGESREPPYRVCFFGPLTFRFRPAPDEQRVYVVRVHLRRGP